MSREQAQLSGVNHNVMRELNRTLVLDVVKGRSPISRAAIAKAAGLAKPTVSAIVDNLIGEGLVKELGAAPSAGGGRPPIMLEFNARSRYVVGAHVGVRRIRVVVADARGDEVARLERATSPQRGPRAVLRNVATMVNDALKAARAPVKRVEALGVCVPGLVDQESGVCLFAPNLRWHDVPVAALLGQHLAMPVYVHNTAHTAAVAEHVEGAAKGATDSIFIYVGTGVGAGVIIGGQLHRGLLGVAGELGHCRIPTATATCSCGMVGCLEAVASGAAIVRIALEAVAAGRPSMLRARDRPTAADVARAADAGDAVAIDALASAGTALGLAASWMVNVLNPQVVVVGGGVADAGEHLLGPLRAALIASTLPQLRNGLELRTSALGQAAEVRGAVLLARQYSETYFRVLSQH